MLNIFVFIIIFLINSSYAQDSTVTEKIRRDKIETILRLQDLRNLSDSKLVNLLFDQDSIVREKATLAYGSIQDTSVLHLLVKNLNDPAISVRKAASFSISQTALILSLEGRKKLEDEIIWKKLGYTGVDEQLIEDIGKFGTEEALNQLMIRFGKLYPGIFIRGLSRSIARFAIRGIYNQEALNYIISFFKPNSVIDWNLIYALMRISAIQESHDKIHSELHNIVIFYNHSDPLVRMHLATVLGRIIDETHSLDPLLNMAEFDKDWRVKVNALKALSNYDFRKNHKILDVFKRALYDENMHIALTAISELGKTNLIEDNNNKSAKDLFENLWRILDNKDKTFLWQYQANAAIALSKLTKGKVLNSIYKNFDADYRLKSAFIEAMANTGEKKVIEILMDNAQSENSMIAATSLEGMHKLSNIYKDDAKLIQSIYQVIIKSLDHNHQAVIATAGMILRDSIFLRKESVTPLMKALDKLVIPHDTDAIVEIIRTLGALKDESAIDILKSKISMPERTVAIAAVDALKEITGKDFSKEVNFQMQPIYVDFDFRYLETISRNPFIKIETIKGDIKIQLFPEIAPFTVMSFIRLAEKGFFKGTYFHRIVPNFVIQGGDPEGTGWGGPGYSLRSEFSPVTFETGYVGMASSGKDTEGSQFFITQSPQPHLDGKYTLFGKVISGMEVVNRIQVDDKVFDIKLEN